MASVHSSSCTQRHRLSHSNYSSVGGTGRGAVAVVCLLALAACAGPIKPVPTQRSEASQPPATEQAESPQPEQVIPSRPAAESPLPLPVPPIAELSRSAESDLPVVEANPVMVVAKRDAYVASRATSGTKTDTPIMDTPVNVQVITQQVIKDQQVIVLDQALKNVSGVTTDSSNFRQGNQAIVLRGFASSTYFRNGFRLQDAAASRAMANVESIEVLKGPAAILYGLVEPGAWSTW